MGITGETDKVSLMLFRARRKDEVEEELTREARRGRGEYLLERLSPGKKRTEWVKNKTKLMITRGQGIFPSDFTLCGACFVSPGTGVLLVRAVVSLVGPGVGHRKG